MNLLKNITIGSDPEFIIVDRSGHLVPADEVFQNCIDCNPCEVCGKKKCDGNRRKCGVCDECDSVCDECGVCDECDACREEGPENCYQCENCTDNSMNLDGEIGCDACSEIGELRPRYGSTPNKHHENIEQLINQIEIPDGYEIRAGTIVEDCAIGGHIHLGINNFKNLGRGGFEDRRGIALYLSRYAGMPLRKIEQRRDLERRGLSEGGYGKFGSHHTTFYGLEWRMPASWLVSSDIALSALSLAHVVAYEYEINPKKISHPSIGEQIKTIDSPITASRMVGKIERMKEYKKYSRELEPLFQMLTNNEKWNTSTNILDEW